VAQLLLHRLGVEWKPGDGLAVARRAEQWVVVAVLFPALAEGVPRRVVAVRALAEAGELTLSIPMLR
jgi:hypothetical protein